MGSGKVILVGDIGGTNARFALVKYGGLVPQNTGYRLTADYPSIREAIENYLSKEGKGCKPTHACIAVACPSHADTIRFTNNQWQFSAQELKAALGLEELRIINDFTAQALAIPYLQEEDFTLIGKAQAVESQEPIAVIGPGTGLGVSGLVPNGHGKWIALSGEGGHVSVAPENDKEIAILRYAQQEYGRVSLERLLCGSGIVLLYRAICSIRGQKPENYTAVDVTHNALNGNCALCRETVMQFCALLGGFAGDMALILGAHGGVYIAGGIVPRFGSLIEASAFRERFENKGRFSSYNAAIPTYIVTPDESPALLGAASVFLNP